MSLVYTVNETRNKIREIQTNAKIGLISELVNKATQDTLYMISSKMNRDLIKSMDIKNICEYDDEQEIYTIFNELVPQIVGEGANEPEATSNMVKEAIAFAADYLRNVETFSVVFNGAQQFLISNIILSEGNEEKVREILKIA